MIDGDLWKDGEFAIFYNQVRSYRDADGVRLSADFPVESFTGAAAGEGGIVWATVAGAVYRTADPVAALEPVEGVRGWNIAAAGPWGAVCSDDVLFRIPLTGALKAESTGRACKRVESSPGQIFVQDADGWSATSDLEVFTSAEPPNAAPRPGRRGAAPDLGSIERVGLAWRTKSGRLLDVRGPLDTEGGPARDPPHELHCVRTSGVSGIRAICSPPGGDDELYGWDDTWSKLHARPDGGQAWLRAESARFSDLSAFTGPCDPEEELEPDELAVCLIRPGVEPRTDRWFPEFCEPSEDCELYGDCDPADDCEKGKARPGHIVFDLAAVEAGVIVYRLNPSSGDDRLVDLRGRPSAPLPSCEEARLVGPFHLECWSEARGVEVFSLADGAVDPIPLPKGAQWAGFASAQRGMAAGANAASVWTTRDGGASWQPLKVVLSGKPDSLPLAPVRCTNIACGAGPVLWVEGAAADALDVESVRYVGFERTSFEASQDAPQW